MRWTPWSELKISGGPYHRNARSESSGSPGDMLCVQFADPPHKCLVFRPYQPWVVVVQRGAVKPQQFTLLGHGQTLVFRLDYFPKFGNVRRNFFTPIFRRGSNNVLHIIIRILSLE